MGSLKGRLNRLEQRNRAAEPDPHARCRELFQARHSISNPCATWTPQTILPESRPIDDPALYPLLSCFVGVDSACPHNRWADYSFRRDKHLFGLRHLSEADLDEAGPPVSPEVLERQHEAVAALRERITLNLSRLEARLIKVKGE